MKLYIITYDSVSQSTFIKPRFALIISSAFLHLESAAYTQVHFSRDIFKKANNINPAINLLEQSDLGSIEAT